MGKIVIGKQELASVQQELASVEADLAKAKEKINGYKGRLENEKNARIADRKELESLRKKLSVVSKKTAQTDTSTWVYRASIMSLSVLLGVLVVGIGTWSSAARFMIVVAGVALTFLSIVLVFKMSLAAEKKSVGSVYGVFGSLWFICVVGIGVLIIGLNLSDLEVVQEVSEKIQLSKTIETVPEEDTPAKVDPDPAAETTTDAVPLKDEKATGVTVTIEDAVKAHDEGKYLLAVSLYRQIIKQAEDYEMDDMKMAAINGLCRTLQKMGKGQEALEIVAEFRGWVEKKFKLPTPESIRFYIQESLILWAANLDAKAVAVLGKAVHLTDKHFKENPGLRWEVISQLVAHQITSGNIEGAVSTLNSHISVVEARRPVDEQAVAVALGEMGGFLLDNAKYQEAIPYFEKATAIYKSINKTSTLDSANMRLDYALALYYRGKKSESMDTLIRAKIIFDRELPEGHESRVAADSLMKRLQK